MSVETNFLSISWTTSRGRDTYGYNICRLDSRNGRNRYKTCGGGYDMVGTVVADWLQAEHQDRLMAIADRAGSYYTKGVGGSYHTVERAPDTLYGMTREETSGAISIDGACGIESVCRIAEAVGISLSAVWNRKGHVTGYMVTDYGSDCALQQATLAA